MSGIIATITNKLISIPGIVIGLAFHEFAHAKVAQICGDDTPVAQGRVTLNPLAHFDIVGLISLLLVGFGWGKPVVINPNNFKKKRLDSILVGIAGVTVNFITALIFAFIIRFIAQLAPAVLTGGTGEVIYDVLLQVVGVNISLMLFNLLPIPPLDGFGVLCNVFNITNFKFRWMAQKYGMLVLIVLVALDIPSLLLTKPFSSVIRFVFKIAFIGL